MSKYKEKEPLVPPDIIKVSRKYNLEIPYEGLEPGETPENAQPDILEYAGVHWATTTTDKWCKTFFNGGKNYEKCVLVMLPKMLAKRNEWERNTWEGIKQFISTSRNVIRTMDNDT